MHPWSYAADTGHTVFYNAETGTYIELDHTNQSSFTFCPRTGMKSKSIDSRLIWKYETLSPAGLQLLKKLEAKKGMHTPPKDPMGSWSTINDFSLTAFSCSSNPNNRIIPSIEGFVYFGTNGTLIVDRFSESYMNIARGKELLDCAISNSICLRIKRRVDSLKVATSTYWALKN
jgi:hypothetical protein